MIIRKMIIEDIPGLAMLYKQFWNENSCIEKMQNQFEKLQHNDTHILLCAVGQNQLVGSVMGIVCEELYGDCRPFMVIENMIVDKNYRKNGIGKALFSELERIAKERNCTQIILVTETDRIDACRFYESMGFKPKSNNGYKKIL
jgi:ribosomal protein S18 acetylase RimI-like enzyme